MSSHKSTLAIAFLGSILMFVAAPSRVLATPANLVRIIDTRNPPNLGWSSVTPSPDPSGISYWCAPQPPPLACADRLLVSDGEVEEMTPSTGCGTACWANANLFEADLQGNLQATSSTTGTDPNDAVSSSNVGNFSNEPVGVTWNPNNGHCFYADDDRDIVFEINPGPDGDCLTPADNSMVAAVRVRDFGNTDPEGVGIDVSDDPSGQIALYVADGINVEVYKYLLGANGQLGGGDDTISHFDTSLLGFNDNEGIEYHPDFGHLFIVSPADDTLLGEITRAGGLVRLLDISSVNAKNPGGVAVAPWSGLGSDPNPERNVYVSERGTDNNSDPIENDGKIYEFDVPPLPTGNAPPSVDAGPARTIYEPGKASLDGTVTDDGLPTPPAAVTTNWSKFTGPGTATFANPSAVDTTVTFSASGTYALLLTADDGGATGSDLVTVTVLRKVAASTIYVSAESGGSIGGFSFGDEDILAYDVNTGIWSLYFDGSDVQLGGSGVDVDAFQRVTSADPLCPIGGILLSMTTAVTITVNGASTLVDDSDIVCFIPTSTGSTTAGTYQWYFDGSDVGLDTDGEDVDVIALTPDGRLVVSVTSGFTVTGASGSDEDLIAFTGSLGETTSGSFAMYFDGSDVGLSDGGNNEDVYGAWIHNNGEIYLSTKGNFSVTGASGDGSDVFICGTPLSTGTNTACTYRPYWDGNAAGLAAGQLIDGADVVP